MTLLATSSSTTEKKISKQGFRIDKFRMPVDAVIFSLGMWWISAVALPRFLVFSSSRKKFCNPLQIVSQNGLFFRLPLIIAPKPAVSSSATQSFEKKRNSSALFAREISLVTQPSFDCEQGINSQVQTACSNADAVFPVLGIVFCKNERFSLSRKTHVPLWNEPRISHVRLPWAARAFRRLLSSAATDACWFDTG